MTREQRIRFCEQCLHRQLDPKQGLICKLSGAQATFEGSCADIEIDESVTPRHVKEAAAADDGMSNVQVLPTEMIENLKLEQNLPAGIIAGLIAGIGGAALWGAITVATGYQIGYMAIGIGALVGIVIRFTGKGVQNIFGIWGAVIALLGVVLGNIFSIIGFLANMEGLGIFETMKIIDYSLLPEIVIETSSPIDILFYILAISAGYRFSFRQITEEDIARMQK